MREIMDTKKAVELLNKVLEHELAGAVRYTHYALMVFGHNRIPIVSWLRKQSEESMEHAYLAGEMITRLGAHPSLNIGPLLESHNHDIDQILREALAAEKEALSYYYELLEFSQDSSLFLEEYARKMIILEEEHADEVNKMLREPGDVGVFNEK